LNLKCDLLVSKFAFKRVNLYRYAEEAIRVQAEKKQKDETKRMSIFEAEECLNEDVEVDFEECVEERRASGRSTDGESRAATSASRASSSESRAATSAPEDPPAIVRRALNGETCDPEEEICDVEEEGVVAGAGGGGGGAGVEQKKDEATGDEDWASYSI
jgi:hypothetical protein